MSQHICDIRFGKDPDSKVMDHIVREPVADDTKPYDGLRMFTTGREGRPFLDRYCPTSQYVYLSWPASREGLEAMQRLRTKGVNKDTVPGWKRDPFTIVYDDIRDQIRALAVPVGEASQFTSKLGWLKSMGFNIAADALVDGVPNLKVAKAMPFQSFDWDRETGQRRIFGEPVKRTRYADEGLEVIWNRLDDGTTINEAILDADKGGVDGNGLVTSAFVQHHFKLALRDGDGLSLKRHGWGGYCKGVYVVKNDMQFDVAHFGGRPAIEFQRYFCGLRALMHAGDPNRVKLDQQSIIHFLRSVKGCDTQLHLVKHWLKELEKEVSTPEGRRDRGLRGRVLPAPGDYSALHDWAMADMDTGLGLVGMFRQQTGFRLETARMTEGKIPVGGQARHAYMSLLPTDFSSRCKYTPALSFLRGNTIYMPYVPPGPVILYRHPNVDREIWFTENVSVPKDHPVYGMGRGEMCWLSPDILRLVTARLGYGDLDDMVMVAYGSTLMDPLVDHIKSLTR